MSITWYETCDLERSSYFSAFDQSYYLFILSWTQRKNSLFSKSNSRRQFPVQPLRRFGWRELWSLFTQIPLCLFVIEVPITCSFFLWLILLICFLTEKIAASWICIEIIERKKNCLLIVSQNTCRAWSFDKICGLISEGKHCNLYFFSLISEFWKHKLKRVNTDRDRRRIFACPCLNCLQL